MIARAPMFLLATLLLASSAAGQLFRFQEDLIKERDEAQRIFSHFSSLDVDDIMSTLSTGAGGISSAFSDSEAFSEADAFSGSDAFSGADVSSGPEEFSADAFSGGGAFTNTGGFGDMSFGFSGEGSVSTTVTGGGNKANDRTSTFSMNGEGSATISMNGESTTFSFTSLESPVSFTVQGSTGDAALSFSDIATEDLSSLAKVKVDRISSRPEGEWKFVVEGRVPVSPQDVWEDVKTVRPLLQIAFQNLAVVNSVSDDEWQLSLASGEEVVLNAVNTTEKNRYHVVEIISHSQGVFPGMEIQGSKLYFQAAPGDKSGTSVIEFGWEGQVEPQYLEKEAELILGSLFQEMVANLEDRFGKTCELSSNFRTIEGHCNNLAHPSRGAANHPLKRLSKNDPSYADDERAPNGPANISPRLVSNLVFAQNLGGETFEKRMEDFSEDCLVAEEGRTNWDVCPMKTATAWDGEEVVYEFQYTGTTETKDGSVDMNFDDGSECNLRLRVVCSKGNDMIVDSLGDLLLSESCNHFGWFKTPMACSSTPSEDDIGANEDKMTDMMWSFGQFIDHDLDLTPITQFVDDKQPGFKNSLRTEEKIYIEVPDDDFYFDEKLEFVRATLYEGEQESPAPNHLNQHSAYLDLGQVYGVDFLRANTLRSFKDGKLKMGPGNLLPKNKLSGPGALGAKIDNGPDAEDKFYVGGDIRTNENIVLLSHHVLWAREHNLVCDEIGKLFPSWDDERIYQTARAISIAVFQSIVYNEWLPILLGPEAPSSSGYSYSSDVDPSVQAFFSTAAFRFGHSMVPSFLWSMGAGKGEPTFIPVRDSFFAPQFVDKDGIDGILRGAAQHVCKEIDHKVVSELRNFIFSESAGSDHHDLMTLNIMRGRDMGLPSYNQAREGYGMKPVSSFDEITDNKLIWKTLELAYDGDVDAIDSFVGGMCEGSVSGSQLGSLFHTAIKDQFQRARDGDRFFYKGIKWDDSLLEAYPRLVEIIDDEVKLADILLRNSGITASELELDSRESVFIQI